MRTLIAVLAFVVSAATSPAFAAHGRLLCASVDFRDAYCPADTRGGVRMATQISRAPCEYGVTWGYDRRGIWVTEGCEAEFELGRPEHHEGRYRRHGPEDEGGRRVVCESTDFRYTYCAARVRAHVDLVEQLSKTECRRGASWGFDREGVWVDRGCAAVFQVY